MSEQTETEAFAEVLDHHYPADDWKCSCGEDLFGGSASYSWKLYCAHTARYLYAAAKNVRQKEADVPPMHTVPLTQEGRARRAERLATNARNLSQPDRWKS